MKNIDFYFLERKDKYTIGSGKSRASHRWDGSNLTMYLDKIWRDTQNFEAFIEGINVVYLTELLCMIHKKGKGYTWQTLCFKNGKTNNDCLFLVGAKEALNSNYTLFKNG